MSLDVGLTFSCCLTSTEARWPIRDGDRVGRGQESDRLDRGNCPKKTRETVDRRQNNGSVKAVSPRHCPATCALCNCSFNCCAGQSLRQCLLHRCWQTTWTTRSKRRPTCSAQLHLPTHDLFWAKVRVQLHLPPLRSFDLAWNPVRWADSIQDLTYTYYITKFEGWSLELCNFSGNKNGHISWVLAVNACSIYIYIYVIQLCTDI